ncbi:MAG TPA: hypothetical protein VEC16_01830 [Alphaproteobacteria bacterium]|nr:hypothetical protein [Alphaproteobacteria bacterium]
MITLLGISLIDFNGYYRLSTMLKKLQPQCVGIFETEEEHKEQLSHMSKLFSAEGRSLIFQHYLEDHPRSNIETLDRYLSPASTFYFVNAVEDYCNNYDVPLLFCGDSGKVKKFDEEYSKNTMDNFNKEMDKLLAMPIGDALNYVENEYYAKGQISKFNAIDEYISKSGDRHAEKLLRKSSGNIVYVSPIESIYGNYKPNLFDRLLDLRPIRIKLNEKI